jgi:hypothetical protein
MKTLHCTHCQNLVFFDNVRCLRCDHVGYVLNNLNRGLGLPDSYPFILTPRVIDKIVFVQRTVFEAKVTE